MGGVSRKGVREQVELVATDEDGPTQMFPVGHEICSLDLLPSACLVSTSTKYLCAFNNSTIHVESQVGTK